MSLYDKVQLRRAKRMIAKRMPGKTLEDVSRMYEQFYDEITALQRDQRSTDREILDCMERYRDVIEISDLFPEEGTRSWGSYRRALEYLSRREESEK